MFGLSRYYPKRYNYYAKMTYPAKSVGVFIGTNSILTTANSPSQLLVLYQKNTAVAVFYMLFIFKL